MTPLFSITAGGALYSSYRARRLKRTATLCVPAFLVSTPVWLWSLLREPNPLFIDALFLCLAAGVVVSLSYFEDLF